MSNGVLQHMYWTLHVPMQSTTCACLQLKCPVQMSHMCVHVRVCVCAGEVVLDQQSSIRTVVNKTDSIDNTFRFFSMELLAGEDNMVATVSENGCTFSFDFSKVYWNSRLHTEHERVVGMLKRGNVVLDMFAGVGPFAIPAAKKGCTVYANDLNPSSYEALVKNVQKNKVTVNAFNMDGAEFLRKIIPQLIEQALGDPSPAPVICSQIIMNLPAIAPQFLGTFRGIFLSVPESRRSDILLPTVHCYCFCKSQHPDKESREMVETHLGSHLKEGSFSIFKVRLVAPNKAMMRVTFELPGDVPYMSVCERVSQQGVLHGQDWKGIIKGTEAVKRMVTLCLFSGQV